MMCSDQWCTSSPGQAPQGWGGGEGGGGRGQGSQGGFRREDQLSSSEGEEGTQEVQQED